MPINIICQRCRTVNAPSATNCEQCGARFCPHCFMVIDSSSASVCPHCGKKDIHYKPGKYVPPAGAMDTGHCTNCSSRIPPGTRKCPYCGKLGSLVTQAPVQGYGMMQPEPVEDYQQPQQQKVCAKCGTPIPPGSSLCPIHGKFGGGSTLKESSGPLMPGRHTGDLWRRIEEKRAASAAAADQAMAPRTHRAAPQDIYPQIGGAQMPPPEAAEPYYEEEQRTCPSCGAPVPNRSKVCPHCGNNRLPPERSKPIMRAEDYYKAKQPVIEPIPGGYGYPEPQPYFGPPAEQLYEPVYAPDFADFPEPKNRKKPKNFKENVNLDESMRPAQQQKKFPFVLLLALLALGGIIVLSAMFVLDQLNAPTQPVITPITTPSSSPKAPIISGIQYSDVTRTSAVVSWTTDKKSSSIVIYCLNGGDICETAKDDALVTSHSVELTDLDPGAAYHITVKSRLDDDPDSPDASKENPEVLRTLETPDTVPPVISDVKVTNLLSSGNMSSAEITWKTDEDSTSQVSYGTSTLLGSLQPSQTDTNLSSFHDVQLYGLPPETTIHYKVISRDAAGNESASPTKTLTTPSPGGSAIGNMAPDFTLRCADGSTVTLSELQGSKVIINFWHLNCPPCIQELPAIQQFHDGNPGQPLLVIHGTALGAINEYAVGSFLQQNEYSFTVPLDGNGQVSSLYNTMSIPRTFFLDSSGKIRKIKEGSFSGINEITDMLASY